MQNVVNQFANMPEFKLRRKYKAHDRKQKTESPCCTDQEEDDVFTNRLQVQIPKHLLIYYDENGLELTYHKDDVKESEEIVVVIQLDGKTSVSFNENEDGMLNFDFDYDLTGELLKRYGLI